MKINFIILLLITLFLSACHEKEDIAEFNPYPANIEPLNSVNEFIWKSMNKWYFNQRKVPALLNKAPEMANFSKYINKIDDPEAFLKSLRYSYDNPIFYNDYEKELKSSQGVTESFGLTLSKFTVDNTSYLIINNVSNSCDAKLIHHLSRGYIISGLNGIPFGSNTYDPFEILDNNNSVDFMLFNPKQGGGPKYVTLTKTEINEDVIQAHNFVNYNGKRIGYLAYNGFWASKNSSLNQQFAYFKSKNLTDFILDLRNNEGGDILTSAYLASLIYGEGTTSDAYMYYKYNENNKTKELNFFNEMNTYDTNGNILIDAKVALNRLKGIQKLCIITSKRTRGASEILINSLKPYMNVVVIGEETAGENISSITLYDSPKSDYLNFKDANPVHKYALKIKAFRSLNKENETFTKITPDIFETENTVNHLSGNNYVPLGITNETLTMIAFSDILFN